MLWEFVISWDNLKNVVISTQRDNKCRLRAFLSNGRESLLSSCQNVNIYEIRSSGKLVFSRAFLNLNYY